MPPAGDIRLVQARAARDKVQNQQYISSIQLANVRLHAGPGELAPSILLGTAERCRNWEWGYLMALTEGDPAREATGFAAQATGFAAQATGFAAQATVFAAQATGFAY